MHDIWNPWHGCERYSEGCDCCYMYYLDAKRGIDCSDIHKTQNFDYPLKKTRDRKSYKIRPGELIRVCMSSDFFIGQADEWRPEAWEMIKFRSDVKFWLLTKRAENIASRLPPDWGSGYPNVILNVTCENQARADERLPILAEIPAAHKGIMCAPMLGPVDINKYLEQGWIEQVLCGGENYEGSRPCDYDWVRSLSEQCRASDTTFAFIETGSIFIKNGRRYDIPKKNDQSRLACDSGLSFRGRRIRYDLRHPDGSSILPTELYHPKYDCIKCGRCGNRLICNGCSDCTNMHGRLAKQA